MQSIVNVTFDAIAFDDLIKL